MIDIHNKKAAAFRNLPAPLQSFYINTLLKYYRRSLQCSYLITHSCPARCKHCDFWKSSRHSEHADINTLEKSLKSLSQQKFTSINLTGGDPLAHPQFFEIIKLCKNIGFKQVSVNTTGLLLNDEILKQYMDAPIDNTILSLDGNKSTHDWFRGIKGAHDKVIQALEMLHGKKSSRLSFVIVDANFDQIPYVAEVARKYGCTLTCQPFDLTLSNSSHNRNLQLIDPEKINIVEKDLKELKTNPKYSHVLAQSVSHIKRIVQYLRKPSDVKTPCTVGYWRTHVNPNGDIFPCYPLNKVGNLARTDFGKIWNGPTYSDIRKKMLARDCPNCLLNCYTTVNERIFNRMIP